jgi:hypothetical protein
MSKPALTHPRRIAVNRSELRRNQRATLKQAKGRTVVLITGSDEEEEKLVVDRGYFEELIRELRAAGETLTITLDEKLFSQILRAADTLDEDIRLGKLRSLEEAFGGG